MNPKAEKCNENKMHTINWLKIENLEVCEITNRVLSGAIYADTCVSRWGVVWLLEIVT